MEAKDRIMDEGEMLSCSLISSYPFRVLKNVIKETAIHQDEISFKAGRESMLEEIVKDCDTVWNASRGRRIAAFEKVAAKWLAEWQAFKKENGL